MQDSESADLTGTDPHLYRFWETLTSPAGLEQETYGMEKYAYYVLYSGEDEFGEDLCGIFESWESLSRIMSREADPIYEGFCFFNQAVRALSLYNQHCAVPAWKELPLPQPSSQPLLREPVPWTPYLRRDYPNPRSDTPSNNRWGDPLSNDCAEPHRAAIPVDSHWVVIVGVCPGIYSSISTAVYAAGPNQTARIRECPSASMAQMIWKELSFTRDVKELRPPLSGSRSATGYHWVVVVGICPGIYSSHETALYAAGPSTKALLRSFPDMYLTPTMIWRELAFTRELQELPPP